MVWLGILFVVVGVVCCWVVVGLLLRIELRIELGWIVVVVVVVVIGGRISPPWVHQLFWLRRLCLFDY